MFAEKPGRGGGVGAVRIAIEKLVLVRKRDRGKRVGVNAIVGRHGCHGCRGNLIHGA